MLLQNDMAIERYQIIGCMCQKVVQQGFHKLMKFCIFSLQYSVHQYLILFLTQIPGLLCRLEVPATRCGLSTDYSLHKEKHNLVCPASAESESESESAFIN